MIDLNHGSGAQYAPSRPTPDITAALSAAIDIGLSARQQTERPRSYVSSSGLGRACLRQIQYDYLAVPKDDGQDFAPKTLRIFEAGHWSCRAYVPVPQLIYAAFRSNANGLLPPSDECLRRVL